MPIADPTQLVEEFKKSGEFDKLRRELLADSQRSTGFDAFKTRIDELARDRIKSGQMGYTAPDILHKDLTQEVNRFPIVERFASEVPMLADSAFKDGIHNSLQRILREDRGQTDPPPAAPAPVPEQQPSMAPPEGEDPPQEAPVVPPVSRLSPADGNKMDAIDSDAPLTPVPETSSAPS
ncbi:hypothetical protein C8R44DRAFT_784546 [Mycena epipterygia]|nr:hypothetical protein C8R44DRAFT_784546 [Mycena epipterygia]